jgi:serine/threonine protein kinase
MIGNSLTHYQIDGKIGQGGMGTVYRARDKKLGKTVAVKVLSHKEPAESDSRKRLRNEARAAAILNHPSIVTVLDYDEEDDVPFVVYEFVEGKTLDQVIKEEPMPFERVVDIASQLASALEYAHRRGILHRDIKPQNIIITAEGRAKILDFGLAKKTKVELVREDGATFETSTVDTAAGTIVGTVEYMSPEQIAGETLDGRTDLFSLGIVLYEMATGANPFRGQNFASIVGKIMSQDAPDFPARSFKFSTELRDIILRCLQKKREERYQGARALLQDLEQLGHSGPRQRSIAPQDRGERTDSVIPRSLARFLLLLVQVTYLAVYGVVLYYHWDAHVKIATAISAIPGSEFLLQIASPVTLASILGATGCCGIPVRLYIMVSVGFDDPETGVQFRKLFPFLFILDEIWALAPLLLMGSWPSGLPLLFTAMLAYLPLSQRTLIRNAYRYK